MRSLLEWLLRLLLRVFFRRIEIAGTPPSGPVVYALNHPNALVDPMFVLCFAPQRVSFLAKAPVFRMPLIGALVRAFDSLPVYRRQDGADPADNRRTLDAARAILAAGGAIALFPEGTSHSDPRLRRLKTGAARIALAAGARRAPSSPGRSSGGSGPPAAAPDPSGPSVVPVGLSYSAKGRFRSAALMSYGAPIAVPVVALDDRFEPPPEAVAALTALIEAALADVTLQADSQRALDLAVRAERIYAAGEPAPASDASMAAALARRRRFVAGHARLEREDPALLAKLVARMERYERTLAVLGLDVAHPAPEQVGWRRSIGFALVSAATLAVLAPLALVGALLHAPAYQLIRLLAFRLGRDPDRPATVKLLGALLFFPLTWALAAAAAWRYLGPVAALVAAAAAPPCGLAAVVAGERLARTASAARALLVVLTRRRLLGYLTCERQAIRDQFAELGERLGGTNAPR